MDSDLALVIEGRWLFLGHFWPLPKRGVFFEKTGAVAKIGSSLKSGDQFKLSMARSVIHLVKVWQNDKAILTAGHA